MEEWAATEAEARNTLAIDRSKPNEWFRKLIESTSEAITVVSEGSGRFVDVNSAFRRTTGFDRQELIGKTPSEVGFLEDRAAYDRLLRDSLSHRTDELEFRTRDREVRCAQTTRMSIEVGGQPALIIIWRDITARKQFENDMARARDLALESARLKSEFMANVSHELRTPLNGIIGISELLFDTALTPEQQEYAGIIENSSRILLTIVSNIMDFSKAASGQLRFEEIDFDPRKVVETALAQSAAQAAAKGLVLTSSIDPAIPGKLRGDPNRLGEILMNLLSNAIKFTSSGEVGVVVTPGRVGDNLAVINFEVRDTGIGMSEADQKRLFQPFVQADGSPTRKYGGTGLGLAICAKLVELMNGNIGIRSTLGHGSTFYFTAQLAKAQAADSDQCGLGVAVQYARLLAPDATRSVVTSEAVTQSAWKQVRILVVEDDLVSKLVIRFQLKKLGYANVETASDGREALETLAKAPCEIVLMDCEMPGMGGFEAIQRIRSSEEGQRHTVVIAVTGKALAGDREKCLAAGIDDYIFKPIRLEELADALDRSRAIIAATSAAALGAD